MIIPSNTNYMLEISYESTKSKANASMTTKTQKRSRKDDRRIRFNDSVRIQETIHINNLSNEEIASTWYSEYEYKQIKEGVNSLVAAVKSGKYEGDSDKDCLRGLERRLKKNSLRRQKIKMYGMMVVLGEQEEQVITGKYDENIIAKAYMSVSRQCLALAHKVALIDEVEANLYNYIETNRKTIKKEKSIRQIIMSRLHRRDKLQENVN
jgi:hypothetical protein